MARMLMQTGYVITLLKCEVNRYGSMLTLLFRRTLCFLSEHGMERGGGERREQRGEEKRGNGRAQERRQEEGTCFKVDFRSNE